MVQPARPSLALSREQPQRPDPASAPRRLLRFEDVAVDQSKAGVVSCRVTLVAAPDRVFVGEGSSVVLGSRSMDAAARATVHAIKEYSAMPFTLESCTRTEAAGRAIVLVVVSVAGPPQQDLAGAVVVRGDETRAAALAVLDATNRWLEAWGRQPMPVKAG